MTLNRYKGDSAHILMIIHHFKAYCDNTYEKREVLFIHRVRYTVNMIKDSSQWRELLTWRENF